jgi:hypothetical protein
MCIPLNDLHKWPAPDFLHSTSAFSSPPPPPPPLLYSLSRASTACPQRVLSGWQLLFPVIPTLFCFSTFMEKIEGHGQIHIIFISLVPASKLSISQQTAFTGADYSQRKKSVNTLNTGPSLWPASLRLLASHYRVLSKRDLFSHNNERGFALLLILRKIFISVLLFNIN